MRGLAVPVATGLTAGPIALIGATLAWYRAFEPSAFGDGQFVVIFLFFGPLGAVLGAITGVCGQFAYESRPRMSAISALVGGGMVAIPFGDFIGLFTEPEKAIQYLRESEWILPASWITALIVSGLILLGFRANRR